MEKTRILLVDDMPLITKSISSITDWESFGYEIAGIAMDGKSALSIMEKEKIDILITDIKMPVMDGIELISRVAASGMKVGIVVLSAYNEYELVRKAFKLGARDYILKSEVKSDELISICDRLRDELVEDLKDDAIKMEFSAGGDIKESEPSLMDSYEIKSRFFRRTIWGRTDDINADMETHLKDMLKENWTALMLINLENCIQILKEVWDNYYDLFSFSVLNHMDETINRHIKGEVFCVRSEQYGVLLYFDNESVRNLTGYTHMLFNNLKKSLKEKWDLDISAGMSRCGKNNHSVQELYKQAETALKYRFVTGKGNLIYYKNIPLKNREYDLNKNGRTALLRDVLRSMNIKKINDAISYLSLKESELGLNNMDQVMDIYERYGWIYIDFSREYGIEKECEELALKYFTTISKTGTLSELNRWMREMADLFIKRLDSGNQILNRAKQYIYSHYGEEISLTTVAAELYVSRGHLSRIFQKETGGTFLDFLNAYRIEKAKEFMENEPELKSYEIAEMVGYKNVSHFSRMFKRIDGRTPSEFKNMKL